METLLGKVVSAGRLKSMVEASGRFNLDRGYRHWDKLRRLRPPENLSHEEWWLAIKLARQYRSAPLRDTEDRPFVYTLADPIPEQLHHIDLRAGGTIAMPEQLTTPETRDQYLVSSLIEEAITSSQLEGAATTREVAREMLRAGREPRDISERMILNNFLTMRRIGKLKDTPLTPELVFELHRLVTDRTLDVPNDAGRIRGADRAIDIGDDYGQVFHRPPKSDQLQQRLADLCAFANGETPAGFVHPVLRAIILHFCLAYDHPFVDGNGRTARALFYWSMLRAGYWLFEFISISEAIRKSPVQYGRAFLYTESDDNDLTYFIHYHLRVIERAMTTLTEYLRRKTDELRGLERELRATLDLNHRQRALVSHALRHPGRSYSIQGHQRSHDIVYQTARTDLLDLVKRGLLVSRKSGRRWLFQAVPDLLDRLRVEG